jgi:hypothetical protein
MISALAPWLNSPSLSGVSVTSTGGIPIVTMLKEYNGQTYLFAFADGNSSHPYSGSTTATITLPSSDNFANAARDSAISYNNDTTTGSGASAGQPHSGTITTDSGSVQITSNRFSDSFLPYELHVYQLY